MNNCPKCNEPIQRPPGKGRPAIYCSPSCRAAASYEIKRILRRLEAFELRRSALRVEQGLDREIHDYLGRTRQEQLVDIEQQIKADEERLRVLLSESRGTTLSLPHERSDQ